ncbi:DUF2283 domain-containing protein [Candidatus Daviesbacteria bacterium]|nr:DUF2283 domain-containing protein [Candidatus Daviesbacteria bacterium]
MKAQKTKPKITYSEDVDILMIQLSDKKVDDSYDTDQMIVQVDKKGEPVILEIFHGKDFLKDLNKAVPVKIRKDINAYSTSIAHSIK